MSCSCASLEGIKNAETNEDNGYPVHKVSEGNKDSIRNWDMGTGELFLARNWYFSVSVLRT